MDCIQTPGKGVGSEASPSFLMGCGSVSRDVGDYHQWLEAKEEPQYLPGAASVSAFII